MDPAIAILLAIVIAAAPLIVRAFSQVTKKCDGLSERTTVIETKMDIYLHHAGFDLGKVNKAIKEHIEDIEQLKQNGSPSVGGCIHVEELYREN